MGWEGRKNSIFPEYSASRVFSRPDRNDQFDILPFGVEQFFKRLVVYFLSIPQIGNQSDRQNC